MLTGHDRCPGGHTHHVLIVRALIVQAVAGQLIDVRGSRNRAAIAAQRVEAHLICGDQ